MLISLDWWNLLLKSIATSFVYCKGQGHSDLATST